MMKLLSGWQSLNRGNNPYVNFNPNENSVEVKFSEPVVDINQEISFEIKIQFMRADNDAVMAELKISKDQAKLSVGSIRFCKEDLDSDIPLPDLLKIDFSEERFLVGTFFDTNFPDLFEFGICNNVFDVKTLCQEILLELITRMKIDFQASQGVTASYKVITYGRSFCYTCYREP